MAFDVRTLQKGDDRAKFDCGEEPLNTFFWFALTWWLCMLHTTSWPSRAMYEYFARGELHERVDGEGGS